MMELGKREAEREEKRRERRTLRFAKSDGFRTDMVEGARMPS